jgi:hypothetical protein
MSLIMSLETYEGIVMTADRLSTLSYYNENSKTTDTFPKTYNAHKLFLTKDGYGISYCGNGKLDNDFLVEQFISEEICVKNFTGNEPMTTAKSILDICIENKAQSILLFCGYFQNISFTIEINCPKKELFSYPDSSRNKVVRYGDTAIADAVLNSKFHYGYSTYRLQDAVDLLVYTNQVTAKYQQFQETLQTVSEKCDVLVLYKNGKYLWLNKNELHI